VIQHEFEKFLSEIGAKGVRDDVKRLGNLILANIDKLAPLSANSSQRLKVLIKLAQKELEGSSTELPVNIIAPNEIEFGFNSLSQIEVGPFRGFSESEKFNLNSRVVLLYGPNGSGKTSFCEALEYALLGNIQEAETKRLGPIEYLENARVETYRSPILAGLDANGDDIEIDPDPDKYRFCFVEKNRIEDFSRIAAKTPAQQNKLIGILFGLAPFNDFVKGFNAEIDPRHIDTIGKKSLEFFEKRKALKADEKTIESADTERNLLAEDEQNLANQIEQGLSFPEFIKYLGTPEEPGRIQKLDNLLEDDTPKAIGITKKSLVEQIDEADSSVQQIARVKKEFESKRDELSFRDLYAAVNDLQQISPDICPACDTPLSSVARNPFEKAEEGCKTLEHLSQLETSLKEAQHEGDSASKQLFSAIQSIFTHARKEKLFSDGIEQISVLIPSNADQLDDKWWKVLDEETTVDQVGTTAAWGIIQRIAEEIERHDKKAVLIEDQREECRLEREQLRKLREDVVTAQETRRLLEERIEKAKKAVSQFDEQNKILITLVETEKSHVELNKRIVSAYDGFIGLLHQYQKSLPARLLANLGETTKTLYNGFNRADPPGDFIVDLRLPLESGQKIEVAYQSNPRKYFDALHVMSEGHMRCLGLAILLAKNIEQKCPVLLFDDPVNAIDEDHREGIRRTLFEDQHLSGTQIILTCHGEEFYKDIQNILGSPVVKESKLYSFLPHDGDNRIKVDSEPTPRNYIVSAEEHLAKGNIRYALADSRRALESLTNRIWTFLSKREKGAVSIVMRRPKMPPELRNLAEQLRKKLNDKTFSHAKKDGLIEGLDLLLGIQGNSKEWGCLNKGTHDEQDRGEFDRITVRTIVEALQQLDAILSAK